VPHVELTAKKWLDSMEKQKKKQIEMSVTNGQTEIQTYIQTDRVNDKK